MEKLGSGTYLVQIQLGNLHSSYCVVKM